MFQRFSYALRIEPRDGQQLNEFPHGVELDARPWGPLDAAEFLNAGKSLGADYRLVIDRRDQLVYAVPAEEALLTEVGQ